jgi:undecaprenyl-diphosphatase
VQGVTEFLPISSSGHLVLVPALLDKEPPGIATTAVLHLGTLAAVLLYFRTDVAALGRFHRDEGARRLLGLLVVGTIPAVVAGLLLESALDELFETPSRVGLALIATGLVLLASRWLMGRLRTLAEAGVSDAVVVGLAQAVALIPGVSRSGMTITASLGKRFSEVESARFSFLLAIPVIFGAGLKELLDLAGEGGVGWELAVGVAVAAVSGYLAIAVLIRTLTRIGMYPFAVYCFAAGIYALAAL